MAKCAFEGRSTRYCWRGFSSAVSRNRLRGAGAHNRAARAMIKSPVCLTASMGVWTVAGSGRTTVPPVRLKWNEGRQAVTTFETFAYGKKTRQQFHRYC